MTFLKCFVYRYNIGGLSFVLYVYIDKAINKKDIENVTTLDIYIHLYRIEGQ